jgi:PrgI family protein
MRARFPQDVDLEDRLVFGLTPVRLGYLILAGLLAFALWNARWGSPWLRALASLPVAGLGAGLAWVRWRGRHLDRWLIDLTVYTFRNRPLLQHGRPLTGQGTNRPAAPPDQP